MCVYVRAINCDDKSQWPVLVLVVLVSTDHQCRHQCSAQCKKIGYHHQADFAEKKSKGKKGKKLALAHMSPAKRNSGNSGSKKMKAVFTAVH